MAKYPQLGFSPPEGTTFVTLVRHGQTEPADPENPFPLRDGHGDPSLTELGRRQADAAAERLRGEVIDVLYVSSLIRTHQTAAPLAQALDMTPREEPDLREIFLGDWEGGVFRQRIEEQHPAALAFREKGEWGEVPGAESNQELIARTSAAVLKIHQNHRGRHVVCFVHGGVIAALCAYACETGLFRFMGSDNCGIHRLAVHDDRWYLRGFNDVNHLLPDLRTPSHTQAANEA